MSQIPPSKRELTPRQKLNRKVGLVCGVVFVGMVGAAYASVPLYKVFCEATGYDGTVRRAKVAPTSVIDKTLVIRFDANVHDLPWDFTADTPQQTVQLGATNVAMFKVTNHSDKPVTGRAVFNVVPEQAAVYFEKLSCFCFSDQTIPAGKTVEMPVLYFVAPGYADDINTKLKKEVTLSYTFYPAVDVKPATASAGKVAKAG